MSIRHGKRLFPDKLPITFSDNRFQQANQGIFKTNPLPPSNKIEHPNNLGIVMVYNVIIFHFSCCHFFPQFLQQHTQCSKVRSQIFLTLELFCAKFPQPFVPCVCVCAFELEKVIVVQRNVNYVVHLVIRKKKILDILVEKKHFETVWLVLGT